MQIYLSGSSTEEPSHQRRIWLRSWSRTPAEQANLVLKPLDADILRAGRLSRGMAVSDSSCGSAVVAVHRFTSTSISDSANKLLISGFLEQTCQGARVPVEKQLHSVDSVREAGAHSRQHKYTSVPEARTPELAVGLPRSRGPACLASSMSRSAAGEKRGMDLSACAWS